MNDDDHLFEDMSPETPGTIGKKTGVSQPSGRGHQIPYKLQSLFFFFCLPTLLSYLSHTLFLIKTTAIEDLLLHLDVTVLLESLD